MNEIALPELCLVVLVGVSGSGKSTFARRHFTPTEVISSDFCRGLVSDDENDQSASKDAFEVLDLIASKRLAGRRLTVVDATNVQPEARRDLLALARAHDVLPVAIVLDIPEKVCLARNASRPDRSFGDHVVRRQANALRRSLRSLQKEGFRRTFVLHSEAEIDDVSIVREPLWTDKRTDHGPFDVIGDIHGCRQELELLLADLGYLLRRDPEGRPIGATHPEGRRVVFLGDLVDRGPDTPGVLRLVMGMVGAGEALCVPGNHENKLLRALRGREVTTTHGLAESLDQLAKEPAEFRAAVVSFIDGLISHYVLDDGNLVVAHAGLKEAYQNRSSGRVRSFALYGETTGETDEYGLPVRYPWAKEYRGRASVLYGHTPVPGLEWVNNTLCLDTGCVFGGSLTALRYPEREVVAVAALQTYYEPVRPLNPEPVDTGIAQREPMVLRLDDVTGRSTVETRHHGRITVREDNAAAALEVMSRFAVDPRWLLYLPPTMSPVATSALPDMLEHPAEAFAGFLSDGVTEVLCEEKHMGSRAVVVFCRDSTVAARRFGIDDGSTGVVVTRTGRPFFTDPALTETLLDRLRHAVSTAGLWAELDSDWLVLDAELLPWSLKAHELLRSQYAATGAAARHVLPDVIAVLEAARSRGLDVDRILETQRTRAANALAYTEAYRRYCWPTEGLQGVQLAPFQILAGEQGTLIGHDHHWHLAAIDRLVQADPGLLRTTRRIQVRTDDPASVEAATSWWEALTSSGGEGMVVKPLAGVTRGPRGLVQPGVKVRGREYLRLIYGPDYTEPNNLTRLRDRNLHHKRSLALREWALGVEALERAVAREPLWRTHQAVFAVLALESEPVDPRL